MKPALPTFGLAPKTETSEVEYSWTIDFLFFHKVKTKKVKRKLLKNERKTKIKKSMHSEKLNNYAGNSKNTKFLEQNCLI